MLCGADSRGLMYAALDTADRVQWAAKSANPFEYIRDTSEKPYLAHRAVSMYTMQRAYFEAGSTTRHTGDATSTCSRRTGSTASS